MILPNDLAPERAEWIRAAGDGGRLLAVGPAWDARTDPPLLCVSVAPCDGGALTESEIERVRERLTAALPSN